MTKKLFMLFIAFTLQIFGAVHRSNPGDYRESQLIAHVKQCIANAEKGVSKITSDILGLRGMSSPKVRHFLNNLCSMSNTHYLEIGCWQGSTLISALYENQKSISSAIAIDNWSEFDESYWPDFGGPKEEFEKNCGTFLTQVPYRFYCEDCFRINLNVFEKPVNIYFYDGAHNVSAQEKAFTYFNSVLDDLFIAIVDDWNWSCVSAGTYAAFDKLHYEVLFDAVLPSRSNGDWENWWNGLYVAVIRKP